MNVKTATIVIPIMQHVQILLEVIPVIVILDSQAMGKIASRVLMHVAMVLDVLPMRRVWAAMTREVIINASVTQDMMEMVSRVPMSTNVLEMSVTQTQHVEIQKDRSNAPAMMGFLEMDYFASFLIANLAPNMQSAKSQMVRTNAGVRMDFKEMVSCVKT